MDRVVRQAQRRAEAVRLRTAGRTYDEIAMALGYSGRSGAFKAVRKALRDNEASAVEEYRTLELARLDTLLSSAWPIATNPEHRDRHKAVDQVLKIMKRQCDLVGTTG
jgi:hypothetical protein